MVFQFQNIAVRNHLLSRKLIKLDKILSLRLKSSNSINDYYEELGLNSNADSRQIKNAFYALSKKYHPDVNEDNPEALRKFQAITEAYTVLSNPRQRRQYDRTGVGGVSRPGHQDHSYEGEDFIQRRAAFRQEFGNDETPASSADPSIFRRQAGRSSRSQLDMYTNLSLSKSFKSHQDAKRTNEYSEAYQNQSQRMTERSARSAGGGGGGPNGIIPDKTSGGGLGSSLMIFIVTLSICLVALFLK